MMLIVFSNGSLFDAVFMILTYLLYPVLASSEEYDSDRSFEILEDPDDSDRSFTILEGSDDSDRFSENLGGSGDSDRQKSPTEGRTSSCKCAAHKPFNFSAADGRSSKTDDCKPSSVSSWTSATNTVGSGSSSKWRNTWADIFTGDGKIVCSPTPQPVSAVLATENQSIANAGGTCCGDRPNMEAVSVTSVEGGRQIVCEGADATILKHFRNLSFAKRTPIKRGDKCTPDKDRFEGSKSENRRARRDRRGDKIARTSRVTYSNGGNYNKTVMDMSKADAAPLPEIANSDFARVPEDPLDKKYVGENSMDAPVHSFLFGRQKVAADSRSMSNGQDDRISGKKRPSKRKGSAFRANADTRLGSQAHGPMSREDDI